MALITNKNYPLNSIIMEFKITIQTISRATKGVNSDSQNTTQNNKRRTRTPIDTQA